MAVFSTPPQHTHTPSLLFPLLQGGAHLLWNACVTDEVAYQAQLYFEVLKGGGGVDRRRGGDSRLNFWAARGAQGPNTFYDLVYLPAKHPDRIVTCGRGLESIALGNRRERDGDTKSFWRLAFHSSQSPLLLSLLGSVHAHLCQSWTLLPSVWSSSVPWSSWHVCAGRVWQAITRLERKRGDVSHEASKWRKVYKSC